MICGPWLRHYLIREGYDRLKASRPLNCVLVINDNYKWTNCFIEIYECRMVYR
jgi:hypothetical protein